MRGLPCGPKVFKRDSTGTGPSSAQAVSGGTAAGAASDEQVLAMEYFATAVETAFPNAADWTSTAFTSDLNNPELSVGRIPAIPTSSLQQIAPLGSVAGWTGADCDNEWNGLNEE